MRGRDLVKLKESRACVYRFYGPDGALLYIGCTINGRSRIDSHRCLAPWFTEAARITLEHFASWADAELAELNAIRSESPKYNVAGGQDRPAAKRALREARALASTMPPAPPPTDEISTAEAVELLGYKDRSSITRLVAENRLVPSRKMPGGTGAFLFWRADIQRLVAERTTKAKPNEVAS